MKSSQPVHAEFQMKQVPDEEFSIGSEAYESKEEEESL
jgi:hypothetical protein